MFLHIDICGELSRSSKALKYNAVETKQPFRRVFSALARVCARAMA